METTLFNGCGSIETEVRGAALYFTEFYIGSVSGDREDPQYVMGRVNSRKLGFFGEWFGCNIEAFKQDPKKTVAERIEAFLKAKDEPFIEE